jgi:hypothetical protein
MGARASADPPSRKPMTGSRDCRARATSGHAIAAPPSSVMRSRRFTAGASALPSEKIAQGETVRCGISTRPMSLVGHLRPIDLPFVFAACPLRPESDRSVISRHPSLNAQHPDIPTILPACLYSPLVPLIAGKPPGLGSGPRSSTFSRARIAVISACCPAMISSASCRTSGSLP